ncbi:unnamed protein product [Acanthoscelides obtectus]|uniref:Uncharacterized protein n=1 Tax=Acanthoscelides obtectus TaxID=200917 RepID=A0A9P0PCF7_ACAOB|nr:unnamed protein product [Acanthoscelides obtectus]CAK1665414.1 hypothetical protein AOBTE_LOCUS24801 [Acanthoscelides obtectus]
MDVILNEYGIGYKKNQYSLYLFGVVRRSLIHGVSTNETKKSHAMMSGAKLRRQNNCLKNKINDAQTI